MGSKLRNIEALQKMLSGEHRTQTRTHTFIPSVDDITALQEKNKRREIGECWVETKANGSKVYWEQFNGYRVQSSYPKELRELMKNSILEQTSFYNCYDDCEKSITNDYGHGDRLMQRKTGRCIDCNVRYESSLKYKGEFNKYANEKLLNNAKAFFEEADQEIEYLLRSFDTIDYANSDGSLDKFKMEDINNYKNYIREQYNGYKQTILGIFDEKTIDTDI